MLAVGAIAVVVLVIGAMALPGSDDDADGSAGAAPSTRAVNATAPENLVVNGGFEDGLLSWSTLRVTGWDRTPLRGGEGSGVAITNEDPFSGARSVQVIDTGPLGDDDYDSLEHKIFGKGSDYCVTLAVAVEDAHPDTSLIVAGFPINSAGADLGIGRPPYKNPPGVWQEVSASLTTRGDWTLAIHLTGPAKVRIDQIVVTERTFGCATPNGVVPDGKDPRP